MDDRGREVPVWCYAIKVKNTFLDIGEEEEATFRRQQSAPPLASPSELSEAKAPADSSSWVAYRRAVIRGRSVKRRPGKLPRRSTRRESGVHSRRLSRPSSSCSSPPSSEPRRTGRSSVHSRGHSSGHSSGRSSARSSTLSGRRGNRSSSGLSTRRCGVRSTACSSTRSTSSGSSKPVSHSAVGPTSCGPVLADGAAAAACRGTPPVAQWIALGEGSADCAVDMAAVDEPFLECVVEEECSVRAARVPLQPRDLAARVPKELARTSHSIRLSNRFDAFDADDMDGRCALEGWPSHTHSCDNVDSSDTPEVCTGGVCPPAVDGLSRRNTSRRKRGSATESPHAQAPDAAGLLPVVEEDAARLPGLKTLPTVSVAKVTDSPRAQEPAKLTGDLSLTLLAPADASSPGDLPCEKDSASRRESSKSRAGLKGRKARRNRKVSASGTEALPSADRQQQAPGENKAPSSALRQASRDKPDEVEKPRPEPLSEEKADMLAMMTGRLSEPAVLQHMQATSTRKLMLAMPVDPGPAEEGMLDVMMGMVVHYEAADSGWAYGTVIAPSRLAGSRGCFRCEGMRPMVAEVRSNRFGDALEWRPGSWDERSRAQTTQSRLHHKAVLKRIKQAIASWDRS